MAKSAFRTELRLTHEAGPLVAALNQTIYENTNRRTFVTFAYGLFDFSACTLTYIGAGHLPLLQQAHSTGKVAEHRTRNLALGFRTEATFTAQTVSFAPNDVFLFLTDGVVEARGNGEEEFGLERASQALNRLPQPSSRQVYEELMGELKRFTGARPLRDDVTVVRRNHVEEGGM